MPTDAEATEHKKDPGFRIILGQTMRLVKMYKDEAFLDYLRRLCDIPPDADILNMIPEPHGDGLRIFIKRGVRAAGTGGQNLSGPPFSEPSAQFSRGS
jgi:hypothetical protein